MADDERDLTAAERALGTERPGPESESGRLAREVWERRLAPLLETIPPADPPAGLFNRIAGRIAVEDLRSDLAAARRRASGWKKAAILSGALAASIAIYVGAVSLQPPEGSRYVAVVKADTGGQAGLIIQFDTATGVATIIPVGIPAPQDRSLEMWHLPQGATRPQSLGLLPEGPQTRTTLQAGPGDIFAVSLEPKGGSPTGQPTQPIYHGNIVKVD